MNEVLTFDEVGFGWSSDNKRTITRRGAPRPPSLSVEEWLVHAVQVQRMFETAISDACAVGGCIHKQHGSPAFPASVDNPFLAQPQDSAWCDAVMNGRAVYDALTPADRKWVPNAGAVTCVLDAVKRIAHKKLSEPRVLPFDFKELPGLPPNTMIVGNGREWFKLRFIGDEQ